MTPTEAELGYLAGILDGEGCIVIGFQRGGIRKSSGACNASEGYHLHVMVSMRHPAACELFSRLFGGHFSIKIQRHRAMGAKKASEYPMAYWQANGPQAQVILEAVLPYLRVKQDQAKVAILFQRISSTFRRWHRLPVAEVDRRRIARREIQRLNGLHHEGAALRSKQAEMSGAER